MNKQTEQKRHNKTKIEFIKVQESIENLTAREISHIQKIQELKHKLKSHNSSDINTNANKSKCESKMKKLSCIPPKLKIILGEDVRIWKEIDMIKSETKLSSLREFFSLEVV